MKNFEGEYISDFYCAGFFGRRYDLINSKILEQGVDFITIKTKNEEILTAYFQEGWQINYMESILDDWTE